MSKAFERIQQMARGEVSPAPIARLLGFSVAAAEPGRVVVELAVDERFANPMGTLHGGVLCDIADAAMGLAYASRLEDGESFTTLELKINFLRPVWRSRLQATGTVTKMGRTVGLVECEIRDETGALVAKVSSTCLTLRGEAAAGRQVPR
jgi:uncharacterized protein (TIGR00369 family)